jgi:hypothetical protein
MKKSWSTPKVSEIKVSSTEHGTHNQGGARGKTSFGGDDHLMGHAGATGS